jgi:dTMP kinase
VLRNEITMTEEAVSLLFAADRIEHIKNELLPALDGGRHVVCDRYYLSNIAYQSLAADMRTIIGINELTSMKLLRPDITLFLDTPPETCMDRIEKHRDSKELYEDAEKLTKIRANFLAAIEILKKSEKIVCIDANGGIDNTFNAIWDNLSPYF